MKDRIADYYEKKLEKCRLKLKALKKSRKGVVKNDVSISLLEDVKSTDLERRIGEIAQEIIYYRNKLNGRKRQYGQRLLERAISPGDSREVQYDEGGSVPEAKDNPELGAGI